ncbi:MULTISPECIES: DUF2997 domain-containing protein [Crocosphaera]|uniref:DUF2997 domain-containing protein n=2 Tax=Crocosphaera watsonii TaxID=263511 RepID=G5J191_CROWT|nr:MULTISPECIES: DUF2997 domain-containing protein [Crocosphaera]EHJ14035.1 hypothetical protein CWATWH0003_1275 [Crocosphaera watsonii WH 0003]NQZ64449.1 DUF2997 domain-containing protein [Crocosphaera sp.]CCQ55396.1 hypothetical protein CWATWH0005_4965 [Crocosphaera watsonii WH 0005]
MNPEIMIKVDSNGSFTIEVKGSSGGNCLSLTQPLEEALGGVDNREFKPEYRQTSHHTNQIHLNQ